MHQGSRDPRSPCATSAGSPPAAAFAEFGRNVPPRPVFPVTGWQVPLDQRTRVGERLERHDVGNDDRSG